MIPESGFISSSHQRRSWQSHHAEQAQKTDRAQMRSENGHQIEELVKRRLRQVRRSIEIIAAVAETTAGWRALQQSDELNGRPAKVDTITSDNRGCIHRYSGQVVRDERVCGHVSPQLNQSFSDSARKVPIPIELRGTWTMAGSVTPGIALPLARSSE